MKLRHPELCLAVAIALALAWLPATAKAAKWTVNPGESIQDAVDAAAPGDTVEVMPGLYVETHGGQAAVHVTKSLRMVGRVDRHAVGDAGKIIIEPGVGNLNGIFIEGTEGTPVVGFRIKGFTVRGFPNNGILTRYVDKFKIEKNESINNLENGIWPVLSSNGLVKRNTSYGSDDSALWVEDSTDIRVIRNTIHSSVTGIEVSQSDDIIVKRNEIYNNVAGIGIYMQPGRVRKETNRTQVVKNHVYDNNKENSAPGGMAGDLPTGGGILVLGVDGSVIKNNLIENNQFYGLSLIDYCTAVAPGSFNCDDNPPDFEPNPDNNRILKNTFINNGYDPQPPDHIFAPLASDVIFFFFSGSGNCAKGNSYTTAIPDPLPQC